VSSEYELCGSRYVDDANHRPRPLHVRPFPKLTAVV
jgi:hypothetical protein